MNEKSAAGGSRNAAIDAAMPGGAAPPAGPAPGAPARAAPGAPDIAPAADGAAPGAPAPVGAKVAPRPGFPPRRPPDRLSQPSTLSLKKSVRTIRFEVMPPCEWPTNQKALMFSFPSCSMTKLTMFCKYSSSATDHVRVGAFGVAMTRRYLFV